MPHKYRKKPTVIEASRYDSQEKAHRIIDWINQNGGNAVYGTVRVADGQPCDPWIRISTLEGDMVASIGDYIIKGILGEFYPCKPDIFEALHERID